MISFVIVIPSLNQGVFLERAINSALNQDYPYKQVFVIDGGSTDTTHQILRAYSDKILVVSEPDDGQSQAINKGFRFAKSSYLSWLNSDDILYPGALRIVANAIDHNPAAKIIYGDCKYIDVEDSVIKPYPTQPFSYTSLVEEALNYIPQPATFFSRELLTTVGSINEQLHYLMDFEYWLRSGKLYSFNYIPETLAGMRIHPAAKSKKNLLHFASELELVYQQTILADHGLKDIDKMKAMSNMYYRAAHTTYWSSNHRPALQYAWKGLKLDGFRPRRLFFQCLLANLGIHMKWFVKNPYAMPKEPVA